MNLEDHPRATRWLRQFASTDVPTAKLLLRTLKLVSHDEFEKNLAELITSFIEKGKPPIALIPIRKSVLNMKKKKVKRIHFGSEARIGQFLENLERSHQKSLRVMPSIDSMRAEKTDVIILVDDILGSGKRTVSFWRKKLSPSIKSWLSYKKCKIIVVTYAAHPRGVLRIKKSIKYFHNGNSLLSCQELPIEVRSWDERMKKLFQKYAGRTSKPGAAFGYGDVMSPIVFQHGCPNNAPVILWSGGQNWEALFPNRGIPPELYAFFGTGDSVHSPEILWKSGQYQLGLKLLDAIETRNLNDSQIKLLTVIGLLLQRVSIRAIMKSAMLTKREMVGILKVAKDFALVDKTNRVTSFGRDVIERFRKNHPSSDKTVPGNKNAQMLYYPYQYKGVQRKSSVRSIA